VSSAASTIAATGSCQPEKRRATSAFRPCGSSDSPSGAFFVANQYVRLRPMSTRSAIVEPVAAEGRRRVRRARLKTAPALLAAGVAAFHHRAHSVKGNEGLEFATPRAAFVGHVVELPRRPFRRLLGIDPFRERSPNLGRKAEARQKAQKSRLSGFPSRKTGVGRPGVPSKKSTLRSSRRFKCAFTWHLRHSVVRFELSSVPPSCGLTMW
jgi:hypothetical protein